MGSAFFPFLTGLLATVSFLRNYMWLHYSPRTSPRNTAYRCYSLCKSAYICNPSMLMPSLLV